MEEEIRTNTRVECSDGACGHSTYLIVNPLTEKLTHVVVNTGGLFPEEHLVPLSDVESATAEWIRLRCTKAQVVKMPLFREIEYMRIEIPRAYPTAVMGWPYVEAMDEEMRPVVHRNVPPSELAVRRGMRVEAQDGPIGRVDEFLVDPESGRISHLVLREGHLWRQKDVSIPVAEIGEMDEDVVHLKLSKREIEALPEIRIRRHAA